MTDGMKLVMSPLMTGRFATVLKPGVVSNLLTCTQVDNASLTRYFVVYLPLMVQALVLGESR